MIAELDGSKGQIFLKVDAHTASSAVAAEQVALKAPADRLMSASTLTPSQNEIR